MYFLTLEFFYSLLSYICLTIYETIVTKNLMTLNETLKKTVPTKDQPIYILYGLVELKSVKVII